MGQHRGPAGYMEGNPQNSDETGKICVILSISFPGISGEGVGEKTLARRGKTNIVHAPLGLAEERSVLPEQLFNL